MSAYAIWSWTVPADAAADVKAAVAGLVEHVEEDHPLIRSVESFARDGDAGTTDYLWIEEYADTAAMDRDHYNDECKALWEPIQTAAQGSFKGGRWESRGLFRRD